MHKTVNKPRSYMFVECPVLMHREWMTGFRRLGMQRGVMRLDIWPNQIGYCTCQRFMTNGIPSGFGITMKVLEQHKL